MSEWTHAQCLQCWSSRNPGRQAARLLETETEICCFCGRPTDDGIYVRADPRGLLCTAFPN
jgi:hypothetical protein